MGVFAADLRLALRGLRRNLGFTTVTCVSLAVGIGAVTTAFAVVDAVEFRPLPYAAPEGLVILGEARRDAGAVCQRCSTSWQTVSAWRGAQTLSAMTVIESSGARWYEMDHAERLLTSDVSGDFFTVLGVRPLLGRTFAEAEVGKTSARVIVLGYDFWKEQLGGNPGIVGQELELGTAQGRGRHTVIGVMPREFRFLDNQAWLPLAEPSSASSSRRYIVIGRLGSGQSIAAARAESRALHSALVSDFPQSYADWSSVLIPYRQWVLQSRPNAGRGRFILLGVTAFVLLVATVNVASLSLARARTRAFEASVRSALGATRGRLVRLFLTETLVLAVLGGAVGLCLAVAGTRLAGQALGADQAGFSVRLDPRVLSFAVLTTLIAMLGAGLVPAAHAARNRLFALLGQKGSHHNAGGAKAQAGLVATAIACSLVLLTGGGVLTNELQRLRRAAGFDPSDLYLVSAPQRAAVDGPRQRDHAALVRAELFDIPGISEVGLGGQPAEQVSIRLASAQHAIDADRAPMLLLTDSAFFAATSTRPLRGRLFTSSDRFGSAGVAVVNEAAAASLWPGEDALGKRIVLGDSAWESVDVVGVIGNARVFNAPLKREAPAVVYRPFDQMPTSYPTFVVRGSGGSGETIALLRRTLARLNRATAAEPSAVTSIEEMQDREIAAERLNTWSMAAFAVMALFLAAVGVFGIVSYTGSLRQREFSIRMALGASPRTIVVSVVRSALIAAAIGLTAGLVGSLLLTRALESMLGGRADLWMLGQSVVVLGVVLALATYLPAWRAARTDPALALRE